MKIVLIDHYDSFTNNVIDWLTSPNAAVAVTVVVVQSDEAVAMELALADADALVLSPGPKHPADALATLAVVRRQLGRLPILGLCLGHQILAVATGGAIKAAAAPHHGSTRTMQVNSAHPGLLVGLTPAFEAATYNSLVVEATSLRPDWQVNAVSPDGELQAMSYVAPGEAPAFGLQFHPESFLSQGAAVIRSNWLAAVHRWAASNLN